jgi:hypothetical protein
MKSRALIGVALGLLLSVVATAQVAPAPSLMNFQGRLTRPEGAPVNDGNYTVRFSLWTAPTGGTEKWSQAQNITVRNGTFAVLLNTSTGAADKFNNALWLEIKVGNDAPLSPRQPLVSVAYAMKANGVADSSITSAAIANGTITADDFAPNLFNPLAWLLGGNSGTSPASHFLGTTDNQPLVFKVNNRRAMQYRYAENTATAGQEFRSINVLGGSDLNSIAAGVVGATIAGGGKDNFDGTDYPNRVTANFGTVGGGYVNLASGEATTVGGGLNNTASNGGATVGGGYQNIARGDNATVGGGINNTASGGFAAISGGSGNQATNWFGVVAGGDQNINSGDVGAIGGGRFNKVSGYAAVVPGGQNNTATGHYSFAAGSKALANHIGTFVWSDATAAVFASTGVNQFLIRATGGVGINTDAPQQALSVAGGIVVDQNGANNGTVDNMLTFGNLSGEGIASKRTDGGNQWGLDFYTGSAARMSITNSGKVGIGTTLPEAPLHIKGNANVLNLEGSDHAYLAFYPRGVAAGREAYIGFPGVGTREFQLVNENGGGFITINSSGNVGIGYQGYNSTRLAVNGDLYVDGTGYASGGFYLSDARYKTHIAGLSGALESILALRGVGFDWKHEEFKAKHFPTGRQIGFIAQEVERVLPELVHTGPDGYKSVAYQNAIPVLVEAMKQQQRQMEGKQQQIDALKVENAELKAKLDVLAGAVAELKTERK